MKPTRLDLRRSASSPRSGTRFVLDAPALPAVEAVMTRLLAAPGGRLAAMGCEQISGGGKRLRARLALAAASALGAADEDAIAWAAAVELLHNATLAHDDVQDGDRMRRGRPALWVGHGVAQAVNAGDFMLMLPYQALSEVAPRWRGELCLLLADHAIATVRGQVNEIDLLHARRLDWQSYLDASAGKTGAMFALPIAGAATIAGSGAEAATRLAAPFVDLGIAFQIQDDVLDLYGDKGRDVVGSDLYEGKVSALVVEHVARRPSDRGWMLELLATPRDATAGAGVRRAIEAFRASGALAGAVERMQAHVERAAVALDAEPELSRIGRALASRCTAPVCELEGVA